MFKSLFEFLIEKCPVSNWIIILLLFGYVANIAAAISKYRREKNHGT